MRNDWLCKHCSCKEKQHNKIGSWMGWDGLTILFCDNCEEYDCCGYEPMDNLRYLENKSCMADDLTIKVSNPLNNQK